MRCILLHETDPFFCLAAEEYLLKQFSDDIFMLWQSDKTVVVGKHQNAMAEINYPFVRENGIVVARRISGGGTVYHDLGNVNFAFIQHVNSPAEISFARFTRPVVEALARLGIEARTSGRNDLLVQGLKVSGNAEHVYKNRVLHHGTLLFNSDLKNLGQAIKVLPGKYQSKAVQSNRSPVANISDFLHTPMPISDFIRFLLEVQLEKAGSFFYELNAVDRGHIQALVTEKFETWDWRFGYSPKYTFRNSVEIDGKSLELSLSVKKGRIEECALGGDYFDAEQQEALAAALIGCRHWYSDVALVFQSESQQLVEAFF